MDTVVSVNNLEKTYADGFQALRSINLEITRGEVIALLGPNGAGKTTLISCICGIAKPSAGHVTVDGYDTIRDFRETRSRIGLVPQELTTEAFETVLNAVSFSRGLFGKRPDPEYIERLLRDVSLWDKRDNKILTLSGGMKRRLLIAKALSHEPRVLFLDEPTAGVDVELRKEMWALISKLRDTGVTIILTTHYIEEAEGIADRVAVINDGEIMLVEDKNELMRKLGKKQLLLDLTAPLTALPAGLEQHELELSSEGEQLVYTFDTHGERTGITTLLDDLRNAGIEFRDVHTTQSSLEEIFVKLVEESR
ncbi:MAG: ABC transporter ATP-binding protein [Pseudohongiellaceae bacterium]